MAKVSDIAKHLKGPTLPVRTDIGRLELPSLDISPSPLVEAVEQNQASEFYKRLTKWILDFDASLDDAHEVGARLVSFGQAVVFHIDTIGYWNPSLITFTGVAENGDPVLLIQHVSQISVLLTKLPRRDPTQPKKPFGFAPKN